MAKPALVKESFIASPFVVFVLMYIAGRILCRPLITLHQMGYHRRGRHFWSTHWHVVGIDEDCKPLLDIRAVPCDIQPKPKLLRKLMWTVKSKTLQPYTYLGHDDPKYGFRAFTDLKQGAIAPSSKPHTYKYLHKAGSDGTSPLRKTKFEGI